ncbi:DNA alkylation repair protein [Sporomusa malonica]|uniref:3-methyladenine DNA glycosylase AlkC n=1 Tax=Sporomusa malonica TaxID=112901 RepID=A0A1W2DYM1_9FIRM|nr:DNA alkylation repair protein [Sporomusa malonica]SMD02621.1 3-methyladenine DNA glycosylase AlkC [Sporomusa malonica]
MAEALKAVYSEEFLRRFSEKVHAAYGAFDSNGFISAVMDDTWGELALKARMRRISKTLGQYLPSRYEDALDTLFTIDDECVGFPYLFFPDFVAVYGQAEEHWDLSMRALERFTVKSSAEFAVRTFLLRQPERMMDQMEAWAKHPNEHVRRLASEGCRPRLPWGEALSLFKRDPTPVLRVLELLKADLSPYVRKSVANNLNDIAKDHPAVVIETTCRWKGKDSHTDWIVRHGCRTLIRKADPAVMELFGYAESAGVGGLVTLASLAVEPPVLTIGESCELRYELFIQEGEPVRIRIEYGIDFVKAKGRTSRKLFLLSDKTVPGGARLAGTRTHSWADLTTRRHYPGEHRITLLVNGREVAYTVLQLAVGKKKITP